MGVFGSYRKGFSYRGQTFLDVKQLILPEVQEANNF